MERDFTFRCPIAKLPIICLKMKLQQCEGRSRPHNLKTSSNVMLTTDVAKIRQETLQLVSGKDLVMRTLIGKAFLKSNSLHLSQDEL